MNVLLSPRSWYLHLATGELEAISELQAIVFESLPIISRLRSKIRKTWRHPGRPMNPSATHLSYVTTLCSWLRAYKLPQISRSQVPSNRWSTSWGCSSVCKRKWNFRRGKPSIWFVKAITTISIGSIVASRSLSIVSWLPHAVDESSRWGQGTQLSQEVAIEGEPDIGFGVDSSGEASESETNQRWEGLP